jgi:hypothetical protein
MAVIMPKSKTIGNSSINKDFNQVVITKYCLYWNKTVDISMVLGSLFSKAVNLILMAPTELLL